MFGDLGTLQVKVTKFLYQNVAIAGVVSTHKIDGVMTNSFARKNVPIKSQYEEYGIVVITNIDHSAR